MDLSVITQIPSDSPRWPEHPYKGLRYYGPGDAPLFAGRDADIRRCSALLALSDTRALLLHGKTGCGKSSFLRAGLVPTMENEGFGFHFFKEGASSGFQALFIRCTNAPLQRLAEHVWQNLLVQKHEVSTPLGDEEISLDEAKQNTRTQEEFVAKSSDGSFLVESLRILSRLLPRTLVLILDQAEEILTLTAPEGPDPNRRGFFAFLQEYNSCVMDVKLIIALRTEFYGRFFNAMNIGYGVRTDAKEYLLTDLSFENLQEAIIRPTLAHEVADYGVPYHKYRFSFEEGLPAIIARDLLAAKQRGGVLPVMQLVCRSLFDELPSSPDRTISKLQYERAGKVEGRVDTYITESLRAACVGAYPNGTSLEQEETFWRHTLYSLVGTEADGTVITRVLPKIDLKQVAKEEGTRVDIDSMLRFLTSENVLLLREVEIFNLATGEKVLNMSLGHDVLGLALNKWLSGYEQRQLYLDHMRNRGRRARLVAVIVGAMGILAIGILSIWNIAGSRSTFISNSDRLTAAAQSNIGLDYRLALLLAAESIRTMDQAFAAPDPVEAYSVLRRILTATPTGVLEREVDDFPFFSEIVFYEDFVAFCCQDGSKVVAVDLQSGLEVASISIDLDVPRSWRIWTGSKGEPPRILLVDRNWMEVASPVGLKRLSALDIERHAGRPTTSGAGIGDAGHFYIVIYDFEPHLHLRYYKERTSFTEEPAYEFIGEDQFREERQAMVISFEQQIGLFVERDGTDFEFTVKDLSQDGAVVLPRLTIQGLKDSSESALRGLPFDCVVASDGSALACRSEGAHTFSAWRRGQGSFTNVAPPKESLSSEVRPPFGVANSKMHNHLALVTSAGGIQLFDFRGRPLLEQPLLGPKAPRNIRFSDSFLVAEGEDAIYYWDLGIEQGARAKELLGWKHDELLQEACRVAGRSFTEDEWSQFVAGSGYRKTCPNLEDDS